MNKINKILLYGGLEHQDYKACQPEIAADNHNKVRVYLDMAAGLLFAATCLSGGMGVLRDKSMFYGAAFIVCAALRMVDMMAAEKEGLFLQWMMYAFAAVLYVLGIVSAASNTEELSVSFIAFTLAVPLLFVMPPIHHIANIVFFDTIFIVIVAVVESGRTRTVDIVDAVFFGVVSCIISTFTMITMYENAFSKKKLLEIASFDILTGMKNRNAYESERESWVTKCSLSLSCIYVDVNGLHELNNAKGHEKGDQMLQAVALEMRQLFGKGSCYRTGGDEFVAFVMDRQDPAVRNTVENLKRILKTRGYSIAVGVATQSAGGIDVSDLTKLAEKRMYLAKEEHYRVLNQNGR